MTPEIAWQWLFTTLALASPLLLAALGELIGERAGVLNIGLEGMMLAGAWAGAAASFASGHGAIGLLAAIGAGIGFAALFGFLVLNLRADAIVAGTGLNLCAVGLTGVFHRRLSTLHGNYEATALPAMPFAVGGALLAMILWWMLRRTRVGLQLRAVGEQPAAADSTGINVRGVRWLATLANGALCGIAGAFLSMAHTHSFAENMTNGRGFIALAIVIFGRWSPVGAVGAALLFGAADGAQYSLQAWLGSGFTSLFLALPYLVTLLTLAGFAGKTRPPAALGQNYENE